MANYQEKFLHKLKLSDKKKIVRNELRKRSREQMEKNPAVADEEKCILLRKIAHPI